MFAFVFVFVFVFFAFVFVLSFCVFGLKAKGGHSRLYFKQNLFEGLFTLGAFPCLAFAQRVVGVAALRVFESF